MQRKSIIIELAIVTLGLVLITSLLNSIQSIALIGKYYGLIFAVLFLYVPFIVMQRRKRKIEFIDEKFSGYLKAILVFLITSVIIFPLFFVGAHYWEEIIYNSTGPHWRAMPDLWKIIFYQIVMIALPEEFFFRGYFQSSLNLVCKKRWRILGVKLGWSWIITAAVFAFAHSLVVLQWWHFAIFFPGLLFGYLRERTGTITAPILFHSASNVAMNWIIYLYNY